MGALMAVASLVLLSLEALVLWALWRGSRHALRGIPPERRRRAFTITALGLLPSFAAGGLIVVLGRPAILVVAFAWLACSLGLTIFSVVRGLRATRRR